MMVIIFQKNFPFYLSVMLEGDPSLQIALKMLPNNLNTL